MKQLVEKRDGVSYLNISSQIVSEITKKVSSDIANLSERIDFISDLEENKLIEDIRRFFIENIAKEIKLCLYNPMDNNRVYMEFGYKVEPFNKKFGPEDDVIQDGYVDFPETCLFDIFIYFTREFERYSVELKEEYLSGFNFDWYDFDFDLRYNRKNKRKGEEIANSPKYSVNKYTYEHKKKLIKAKKELELSNNKGELESNKRTNIKEKDNVSVSVGHTPTNFEKELLTVFKSSKKLNYVIYSDLDSAVLSISKMLKNRSKIPVRWSVSRGFNVDKSFKGLDSKDSGMQKVKDPHFALNFIIDNNENRVSYILEDFHHYIGNKHDFNSQAAQIRSTVRDLKRSLSNRDEYVFILSPVDSIPIELVSVFNIIKQESEGKIDNLSRYGTDMTSEKSLLKNKPLISRDKELKRVIQVLCQMETNNPLLVGEAGVGKTALVEGLAEKIANDDVPAMLKGKKIFSLNLNSLIAGSRYRGDFEERINKILEEVKSYSGDLIVFIDEIHTLMGAGSAEGAQGAEDVLKPALARGDFPCIGATTFEGYEILERDPALSRRFQKVEVTPADKHTSEIILKGIKHIFEDHHSLTINDEAISASVNLSEEHIVGQYLPGKAVRLLDSTCSYVKLEDRNELTASDVEDELTRTVNRN